MLNVRKRQRFGVFQIVDSAIERDSHYNKYVLCYNERYDILSYVPLWKLKYGMERVNKSARLRYHHNKPNSLDYHKKHSKERYHNNKQYQKNKKSQMKDYYHNNPEYFKKHRESDKVKEYHAKIRKTSKYKEYMKQWRLDNKEKSKAHSKKYRESKKNIEPVKSYR